MRWLISILCLTLAFLVSLSGFSQEDKPHEFYLGASVNNGDTVLLKYLKSATITAPRSKNYRNTNTYKRTLKRVKKVYPYALLGADMYEEYIKKAEDFSSKKENRKYLKAEEKQLKQKFEGQVRNITIKEGIILVKLIDRETSYTSYEVLQEIKGNGSAFLWQGIARIFSSSLKHEYDPEGEDWMIEEIVQRIRNGEIKVETVSK